MTRPRHSIDGFIPRRPESPLNRYERSGQQVDFSRRQQPKPVQKEASTDVRRPGLVRTNQGGLSRADIDDSLRELDEVPSQKSKKRRSLRLGRPRHLKRIIKWLLIAAIVIGLTIGGWLGYNGLTSIGKSTNGGLLGLLQRQPLKEDASGRSNVLIFGTSEDSPDHNTANGGGPLLTDSMMVLSVNQEKKDAFMVSIPRDLWIKFDEPCSVGWQEKINSVYQCGSDFGENPEAGAAALRKKIGEVLGLDIQYYAQIDYSVVTRSVDAVGGVDVTIESNPPGEGILDRNFDWKCNYKCYYVKYEDGEKVHLDGEHALYLSRARNAAGGYGIMDNFGREKNQQKVLKALREKALSVGTLTNVGAVTKLMNAMGDNLKTNVDTSEIQTIIGLAGEVESDAILSLDLRDQQNPLVTTGPVGSASAVYPVAGLFEYGKIQAFIKKASSTDAAIREGATISVMNGTGIAGAAQREANWLEEQGFQIGDIDNAPDGEYPVTKMYQRNQAMSATKKKLESLYGVKMETASPIPIDESVDFLIIIGESNPSREQ